MGASSYQNNRVNQWTSSIVEQCLNQLTKLGKPFKYIGKIRDTFGGPYLELFLADLLLSIIFRGGGGERKAVGPPPPPLQENF